MNVTIHHPCQENWEAMSPTEQGKFCAACQKEVTDFTKFSLAELQQFLLKEPNSCGRFQKQQLEEFNAQFQAFPTPSKIRTWAAAAVLTAVVTLPSFGQETSNSSSTNPPTVVLPASKAATSTTNPVTKTSQQKTVVLAGQVYDVEAKEPLPFANVVIEGTEIGITTDFDGNFKLEVPFSEKPIVLIVSYIGYPTAHQTIVPNQSREQLLVEMKEGEIMGNVTIGLYINIPTKKDQRAIRKAARKQAREEKRAARKNK